MNPIEKLKQKAEELARTADSILEDVSQLQAGNTNINIIQDWCSDDFSVFRVGDTIMTKYGDDVTITKFNLDDNGTLESVTVEDNYSKEVQTVKPDRFCVSMEW
jgi:hypothetical protein